MTESDTTPGRSADEIRASIRETVRACDTRPAALTVADDDAARMADALMDRVVGPPLAERDAEIADLRRQLNAESDAQALMHDEVRGLREAVTRVRDARERLADRLAKVKATDPGFPDAYRDAAQRAQAYQITLDELDAALNGTDGDAP